MMDQSVSEQDFMSIGDHVCLYCTEVRGYVFNDRTSSSEGGLFIFHNQNKDRPEHIVFPQTITYHLTIQNRYKLNKKYRQLVDRYAHRDVDVATQGVLELARQAAHAENLDNEAEQRRLHGKPIKYGDIIQLQHLFSGSFMHVNTRQTSRHDKSKLVVQLLRYDAKSAHFKILPKYKVNVEGECVRYGDQVVLESVKSPGQYLHASHLIDLDHDRPGSELNIGVDQTEFTVVKRFRRQKFCDASPYLWSGAVVQIQHRDLEAYLCAEGIFGQEPTESVHLLVREANIYRPETLYPLKTSSTFWQLEPEDNIIAGEALCWLRRIRLRHLITRLYFYIDGSAGYGAAGLTEDGTDPRTVFRLHAMHGGKERIVDGMFTRVEHVLTGRWLHGARGEQHIRKTCQWKSPNLKKVYGTEELFYCDAFCLQRITFDLLKDSNFFLGIVPSLRSGIKQMRRRDRFDLVQVQALSATLVEVKDFLLEANTTQRKRFMRDMKLIDMLVEILRSPMEKSTRSQVKLLFVNIYELLYTSINDQEIKNCLYLSEYLDFFQAQLTAKDGYSVYVTRILVELLKDKKQVIERITRQQIDKCIHLLRKYEHYRYLQLLSALCVCNDVAFPENQSYIADKLLQEKKSYLYHFEYSNDQVQIWKKKSDEPMGLAGFLESSGRDDSLFLEEQLSLFESLCHGRNQHCIEAISKEGFITWEVAFSILTSRSTPHEIQAMFCEVVIALFVDVGENISLVNSTSNSFLYDKLDLRKTGTEWLTEQLLYIDNNLHLKVTELQKWLLNFLCSSDVIVVEHVQRNRLLLAALKLVYALIQFGYLGIGQLQQLLPTLLHMMSGVKEKEKGAFKRGTLRMTKQLSDFMPGNYKLHRTSQQCEKTRVVLDIMYRGMLILELLQTLQSSFRLQRFIATYKDTYEQDKKPSVRFGKALTDFLYKDGNPANKNLTIRRWFVSVEDEYKAMLNGIMDSTEFIDQRTFISILLDLGHYPCEKLVTKSLEMLRKYFNSTSSMLETAKYSQLLLTSKSQAIDKEAKVFMPLLRRLVAVKIYDDQVLIVCAILEKFRDCCFNTETSKPNYVGQNILGNHGMLPVLMSILQMEEHGKNGAHTVVYQGLIRHTLELLTSMTSGNRQVQEYLFTHLHTLLHVKYAINQLADMLEEVFNNNPMLCWKIDACHIRELLDLVCIHRDTAPGLLQVLQRLVALDDSDTLIRRNQVMLTKRLLEVYHQCSQKLFDVPASVRRRILLGQEGETSRTYFINLTNTIAVCAKGATGTTQSFSQNILPMDELLSILSDPRLGGNIKRPFAKYLVWVYIAPNNDEHINMLKHNSLLWEYMQQILQDLKLSLEMLGTRDAQDIPPTSHVSESFVATANSSPSVLDVLLFCVHDAVIPLLQEFCNCYVLDTQLFPAEGKILKRVAVRIRALAPILAVSTGKKVRVQRLKTCLRTLGVICSQNTVDISATLRAVDANFKQYGKDAKKNEDGETELEVSINKTLLVFVDNCTKQEIRDNTVGDLLGKDLTPSLFKKPYFPEGVAEELPLKLDFQRHVKAFLNADERLMTADERYYHATTIIRQLRTVARKAKDGELPSARDDTLELNCLQLLRTMLHNMIILLPQREYAQMKGTIYQRRLQEIVHLQNFFMEQGLLTIMCDLLARNSGAIFQEVMALYNVLLYGANIKVQNCAFEHFRSSREELIFMLIQQYIRSSAAASRDRKSFEEHAQQEDASADHVFSEDDDDSVVASGKTKKHKRNRIMPVHTIVRRDTLVELSEESVSARKKGDATIRLILKVLAGFCDGQHRKLQDYIREQPDNPRTYNLVATLTEYLGEFYTSIHPDSIDLVIHIFNTLHELCIGNQKNRCVVLDSKIVDYINFMLRYDHFKECSIAQVLQLQMMMSNLLLSLMEESSPEAIQVAKDIATTLDVSALLRTIKNCYDIQFMNWWSLLTLRRSRKLQDLQSMGVVDFKKLPVNLAKKVGHGFTIIYARVKDVHSGAPAVLDEQKSAMSYYLGHIYSIEVIKDGHLQKVHFPVSKKYPIRTELRDKLKWNIDRSSPTNKIRDFMRWSKVIIKDIYYQDKILSNLIARLISKQWFFWNYMCIFLSLVINVIMLSTWQAEFSVADLAPGATALPSDIHEPSAKSTWKDYDITIMVLGITHNVVCVMLLISFFLTHQPSRPQFDGIVEFFSSMAHPLQGDDNPRPRKKKEKMRDNVTPIFSVKTFYYFLMVMLSFGGTATSGYFFAFHLLNIVTVNELLKGVIRAVTLNGRSLIWVAVLGLVVLYLYALIGFAFFRASFDPAEELYCSTLYECGVTIIRYGLLGDLGEFMRLNSLANSFRNFGFLVLYQVTFFIFFTTIGLNIIFGIIVDTFSELRDLKWVAEKDMKECCFICSLPSYDFEHRTKGFQHHIKLEHSMWSYIYYFIYLTNTNPNDYTAIDYYVSKLKESDDLSFFPLNRSLSLQTSDEGSDEKMESVAQEVHFLVQAYLAEKSKQHEKDEKKQNSRWKKRYGGSSAARSAFPGNTRKHSVLAPLGPGEGRPPSDDDDDDDGGGSRRGAGGFRRESRTRRTLTKVSSTSALSGGRILFPEPPSPYASDAEGFSGQPTSSPARYASVDSDEAAPMTRQEEPSTSSAFPRGEVEMSSGAVEVVESDVDDPQEGSSHGGAQVVERDEPPPQEPEEDIPGTAHHSDAEEEEDSSDSEAGDSDASSIGDTLIPENAAQLVVPRAQDTEDEEEAAELRITVPEVRVTPSEERDDGAPHQPPGGSEVGRT